MGERNEQQGFPLLELKNVKKRFGAVDAVSGVSLRIFAGEVTALLGDNGAGKSTLCKIISGAYRKDSGEIFWRGEAVEITSPDTAAGLGISMMYQDLALVDHVDVSGNVFLGREPSKRLFGFIPILDQRAMREKTRQLLERVDIRIPKIDRPVARLSGGQRQAAGVARILLEEQASLLLFDEPLAALGLQEEKRVIALLRNLKKSGFAIVVVSHNLEHVFSVADRIAVLHTGKMAGVLDAREATREQVVGMVMGGGGEKSD